MKSSSKSVIEKVCPLSQIGRALAMDAWPGMSQEDAL